ncbi:voltage-dependent calcium channel type A subunit alpha-1-like isoform X2 [Daktulosphaira vitifoliae]|uniref:voltage-dependent calcium channel type A subunit alpha-1-like isoform X2 n=1 Tax=Daktulosphaira vitifoliae TaxID=58002 RepID=UPI0021A98549|nr:voltage-dependent calcium channel type A subunit alpha-1-like isoform X2 [Daktulosphaira vitifoliae]
MYFQRFLTQSKRLRRRRGDILEKVMELTDVVISSRRPSDDSNSDGHQPQNQTMHLHPGYRQQRSRSPSIRRERRTPSPTRRYHLSSHGHHYHHSQHPHEVGFSDTVSNVVEMVKQEHRRHPRGSWSASTSPVRSPSPDRSESGRTYYGTTSLDQRSRSPSPVSTTGSGRQQAQQPSQPSVIRQHAHHHPSASSQPSMMMMMPPPSLLVNSSYPVLAVAGCNRRRLPATPNKPSSLQLRPPHSASINFPKLNASPTRGSPASLPKPSSLNRQSSIAMTAMPPLSFEQAMSIGRSGRLLPSPVRNGFTKTRRAATVATAFNKSRGSGGRHSDSDEDDWC